MSARNLDYYLPDDILKEKSIFKDDEPPKKKRKRTTKRPKRRASRQIYNDLVEVDQETDTAKMQVTMSNPPEGCPEEVTVFMDLPEAMQHISDLEMPGKKAYMYVRKLAGKLNIVRSKGGKTSNLISQVYVPTFHDRMEIPKIRITQLNGNWLDCRQVNAVPIPQWSFLTPRVSYQHDSNNYVGWSPSREPLLYHEDEFEAAAELSLEDIKRGYGTGLRQHLTYLVHRAQEVLRPYLTEEPYSKKEPLELVRDILTTAGRRELGLILPRGVRMQKNKRCR